MIQTRSLLAFSFLTSAVTLYAIDHGTIHVSSSFSSANAPTYDGLTFNSDTSENVTISTRGPTNKGDYALEFGTSTTDDDTATGVLISSVAENGRSGNYATAQIATSGTDPGTNFYFLPIFQAGVSETEINMNVSFGYFPHTDFWGGRLENSVNNGVYDSLTGTLGPNGYTSDTDPTDGISTLVLGIGNAPGSALPGTSQNGILLVSGAKNEANYALSRANSDGTFTIFCHDNNANQDTYENDPYAFVYIPFDHSSEQIVAMGRIAGIAQDAVLSSGADNTAGDFTLTKGTTGRWYLEIEGSNHNNATLLLSPEGGDTYNIDNIVSAEWDRSAQHWEIQTRDLVSTNLQDTNIGEPSFSFVVLARPTRTLYVDPTAGGGTRIGQSWGNAYTDLQDGIEGLAPNDTLWVAQGLYKPSEGSGARRTFTTLSHTAIYGGFPAGGGTFESRDTELYPTVLSGDVSSTNAYHVVTVNANSTLDGLVITEGETLISGDPFDGNEDNPDYRGAGIYLLSGSGVVINGCTLIDNAATYGGALSGVDPPGTPVIRNSAFYSNSANLEGGAISFYESSASLRNCIFVGNSAGKDNSNGIGGAICSQSTSSKLYHCTLYGNSASLSADSIRLFQFSPPYNLPEIYDCILSGHSSGPELGVIDDATLTDETDPKFVREPSSGDGDWSTLGDNDYGDLRLQLTSPAVDAGLADSGELLDFAGAPRFRDGDDDGTVTIDLGAYEFQLPIVTTTTNSGEGSLRQAVADAYDGGTIHFSEDWNSSNLIQLSSQIILDRSVIIDASALSAPVQITGGGRIFLIDDGDPDNQLQVELSNLTLRDGSASSGGAIYNGEDLTAIHCNFIHNVATSAAGGAVYNQLATAHFINCAFENNSAIGPDGPRERDGGDARGGALYNLDTTCHLTNCTFVNNSAAGGRGGESYFFDSFILTNGGDAAGGAIYNRGSTAYITNCTFTKNLATGGESGRGEAGLPNFPGGSEGGAIYNEGTSTNLDLKNSIIWSNTANGSASDITASVHNASGAVASYTHNLIANSGGSDAWRGTLGTDEGNNLDIDPQFIGVSDFQLAFGSPAIGAGDDAANSELTDINGNARKIETIELGAYESSFPNPTALSNWAASQGFSFEESAGNFDADLDGRTLLEEFAFGTNPNLANDAVTLAADVTADDYYEITIPVRSDAVFSGNPLSATVDGITYTIEGSIDLVNFNILVESVSPATTDSLSIADNNWKHATFRFSDDTRTQRQGFLRVSISEAVQP